MDNGEEEVKSAAKTLAELKNIVKRVANDDDDDDDDDDDVDVDKG